MYNYLLHFRTYLIIKRKQCFDLLGYHKGRNYSRFIILCAPRSGSTLLHTYLNSHPRILSYGEILREESVASESPTAQDFFLTEKVFSTHTAVLKAVGLKLFYEYATDPLFATSFKTILEQTDVRVIHLVRHDVLKLYISLKIAQKSNVWSSVHSTVDIKKIKLDVADYEKFKATYETDQQKFATLFSAHPVLQISYESLTLNKEQTLAEVQHFLGVEKKRLFTLLKKQNTDAIPLIIENYNDLRT